MLLDHLLLKLAWASRGQHYQGNWRSKICLNTSLYTTGKEVLLFKIACYIIQTLNNCEESIIPFYRWESWWERSHRCIYCASCTMTPISPFTTCDQNRADETEKHGQVNSFPKLRSVCSRVLTEQNSVTDGGNLTARLYVSPDIWTSWNIHAGEWEGRTYSISEMVFSNLTSPLFPSKWTWDREREEGKEEEREGGGGRKRERAGKRE